ncbi:MAG: hypothetical protein R3C05_21480 [Pirellulaceae bacterium]
MVVNDGTVDVKETITIDVASQRLPVLAAIANKNASEHVELASVEASHRYRRWPRQCVGLPPGG